MDLTNEKDLVRHLNGLLKEEQDKTKDWEQYVHDAETRIEELKKENLKLTRKKEELVDNLQMAISLSKINYPMIARHIESALNTYHEEEREETDEGL